ncbi:type 2 lanthipeptide synthetase LanM [Streptomyces sp. NPDC050161]|uniref:type 2 lanthipeptide synthetase LanM n=1 Tax=Streptomyces sp. NPDC050161 TaxID=3365604 RepID=UPI0037AF7913
MSQTEPSVSVPAFLPFYLRIAPRDDFARALAPVLDEVVAPESRDTVVHRMWDVLVCTVEGHSYRTLIGEFHQYREAMGLAPDPGSSTALDAFAATLRDTAQQDALLDRYPMLRQRLTTVTGNILAACREVLDAYRDDTLALSEAFGLDPAGEAITELEPSSSDPHNGNRRVVFLTTSGGHRLVYKPRALTGDDFLRDLYRAAGAHLTHPLDTCVPDSVTVGAHGWQRFTAPSPMDDAGQVPRYFYRFGALTCLLSAIGSTDLHDENLLAHGEYPCVIDTETLLRGDGGVANDSLPHILINHMKNSASSTMLLPVENPDSVIDVIMSGAGLIGEQQSEMRAPTVTDKQSDAIRVEWDPITYAHTMNVPTLGDEQLSIADHFPHVMAGYRDALAFLRTGEADKTLAAYPDIPVRSVLRSTEVYSRYLDASTHPKYLVSQAEADRLHGLLSRKTQLTPEQVAYLRRTETASLNAGDIPYFFTHGSSTALASGSSRLPGFFKLSALDNARRGVRAAAGQHERYHQFLIEECLGGVATDPRGLSAHGVFGGDTLAQAAPGAWGFGIAEVLRDLAVTAEGPDGAQAGWLGSIGPDRGVSTITPGNYVAFHDMGGITSLMRRAASLNPRHAASAQAADAGFAALSAEYHEVLEKMPDSVFSGLASVLLSRPHGVDDDWTGRLIGLMQQRGEALEADVSNGPAGVLMAVLARIEQGHRHRPEHVDALVEMAFGEGRPAPAGGEMELAHGALGLYWAKARAGRVLGDEKLTDEAFGWLSARLDAHPPAVTGWCKGAAGVLVAAVEICRSAGRPDWLADGRLAALADAMTVLDEGPVELSVCHGTSGVVQALVVASRATGDRALIDRARAYQGEVIDRARRYGFYTGAAGRTSLIGYMLGWSGVADTDLMLAAPDAGHRAPVALIG